MRVIAVEVYVVATAAGGASAPTPVQVTSGARGTRVTHGLANFIAQEEMHRMEGRVACCVPCG